MNLLLTRSCNERCPFCYGGREAQPPQVTPLDDLLALLAHYARLVAQAPPAPAWQEGQDTMTRLQQSARAVNLLGGEPTLHPHFVPLVHAIADLGLGPLVFTNGSQPDPINRVADELWSVCINGHFAARAPQLHLPPGRLCANLALRPGDDVLAILGTIHDAGIRALVLAFATPAGGAGGPFFTPDDLPAMQQVHMLAETFCQQHGIHLGYDCAWPWCVHPGPWNSCSAVPIMDVAGQVSICGGQYFMAEGARPLTSFSSLHGLLTYCLERQQALRQRPAGFAVCGRCRWFDLGCQGMCLGWREE